MELAAVLLLVLILMPGCGRGKAREPVPALSPGVAAALSTNVIRVGDVFGLTISAVHSKSDTLSVPELTDGKDIMVRNRREQSQPLAGDQVRTTMNYDLTSFVIGEHTVSTGAVQLVHRDGTSTAIPFPVSRFTVQSVLTSANTPWRDIKGLARWPGVFPRWITGLLLIAFLAGIVAFAVHRFLSLPRTILQYPSPPPPHEVALQALRNLLAKGWIESGNIEPFYVELSTIVRHYLEDRFGLRAPERTTEEFIRDATNSRLLSSDHQMLTCEFLEQCDLVKFARHRPGKPEMNAGYAAAERLIRETIPAPTPSNINHQPSTISS